MDEKQEIRVTEKALARSMGRFQESMAVYDIGGMATALQQIQQLAHFRNWLYGKRYGKA